MSTATYIEEKILSKDLRYGNKIQKEALLKFVNQSKFDGRKPTPEELIKECLDKNSPLYGLMKTNRKDAAEYYWRATAQDIIRHIDVIRIDVVTRERIGEPVKAYVPIKRERFGRIPEEHYVPMGMVAADPILKKTVLKSAYQELRNYIMRYKRYSEFVKGFKPVIEAFEEIDAKVQSGKLKLL